MYRPHRLWPRINKNSLELEPKWQKKNLKASASNCTKYVKLLLHDMYDFFYELRFLSAHFLFRFLSAKFFIWIFERINFQSLLSDIDFQEDTMTTTVIQIEYEIEKKAREFPSHQYLLISSFRVMKLSGQSLSTEFQRSAFEKQNTHFRSPLLWQLWFWHENRKLNSKKKFVFNAYLTNDMGSCPNFITIDIFENLNWHSVFTRRAIITFNAQTYSDLLQFQVVISNWWTAQDTQLHANWVFCVLPTGNHRRRFIKVYGSVNKGYANQLLDKERNHTVIRMHVCICAMQIGKTANAKLFNYSTANDILFLGQTPNGKQDPRGK